MDLFTSAVAWFLLGMISGLALAILLGVFAFTVAGAVAVSIGRPLHTERSTAPASVGSVHRLPFGAEGDELVALGLEGLKFTKAEARAALVRIQDVPGTVEERLAAALRTLNRAQRAA